MIIGDYHLHSSFSGDSDTPMEEMIEAGIKKGLQTMCFTEHMDIDYVYYKPEEEGMFLLNADSYLYELLKLREKYINDIEILFGVEIGLQPQISRQIAAFVRNHDFDFVIGSVHLCHGKDPYFPSFFDGRSDEQAYREYFETVLECINACGNFDVLGHLDYIVRYGATKDQDYSFEKYQDVIDPILKTLIRKEKGIEVNTGVIPNGLKDFNPCFDILKRYLELGGDIITVGSDAHSPEQVGNGFDKVCDTLISAGYEHYTLFNNRMPVFRNLK